MENDIHAKKCLDGKVCESKVYNARTLPECESENAHRYDICDGLIAKVPVLIAEPEIEINVEAEIRLDEPALEIKRIKKNLFLTQCKLIRSDKCKKGKLFIGGFVRKNIEYATAAGQSPEYFSICGDIHHTTVKIPFECVTEVDFISSPEFCESGFTKEIEIYGHVDNECHPCEDKIIGHNPCEHEYKHYECFSEKVFCELVDAKIMEVDIHKSPSMYWNQIPNEHLFDCLVEKMVICMRLKLLQNQQIKVHKTDYDNYKHRRSHGYFRSCLR
jgi:hypothetical protein